MMATRMAMRMTARAGMTMVMAVRRRLRSRGFRGRRSGRHWADDRIDDIGDRIVGKRALRSRRRERHRQSAHQENIACFHLF